MQGLPQLTSQVLSPPDPRTSVPPCGPADDAPDGARPPPAAPARVTAFLLPLGREQIPLWVFVPAALSRGTAAVVVHLDEQGLQVFGPPGVDWGVVPLQLHVVDGEGGASSWPAGRLLVQRLWRRTVSHSGDLHGLAFLEPASPAVAALRRCRPEAGERRWVRCVIEPLRR